MFWGFKLRSRCIHSKCSYPLSCLSSPCHFITGRDLGLSPQLTLETWEFDWPSFHSYPEVMFIKCLVLQREHCCTNVSCCWKHKQGGNQIPSPGKTQAEVTAASFICMSGCFSSPHPPMPREPHHRDCVLNRLGFVRELQTHALQVTSNSEDRKRVGVQIAMDAKEGKQKQKC